MKFTFERPLIQGDVVLKRLTELPEGASLSQIPLNVLQVSEVTGNYHRFKPDAKVSVYQVAYKEAELTEAKTITPNEGKIVVVHEEETLFHGKGFEFNPSAKGVGDHNAVKVPPGIYFIDIVREFNYDLMEVARVVD